MCTKVELAVHFFAVDEIESIWYVGFHVADFKVEPLMKTICVDVWVEDQIILIWTYLQPKHQLALVHL